MFLSKSLMIFKWAYIYVNTTFKKSEHSKNTTAPTVTHPLASLGKQFLACKQASFCRKEMPFHAKATFKPDSPILSVTFPDLSVYFVHTEMEKLLQKKREMKIALKESYTM